MKYLIAVSIVFFGLDTLSANGTMGKWEGYCQMSVSQQVDSSLWNYEFADSKGSLETKDFSDNRCKNLKTYNIRVFNLQTTPLLKNTSILTAI